MILHTVTFRLIDSEQLMPFLESAALLAEIPGVTEFEILKQVGKKNSFTHALSMRFKDQLAYDSYNAHSDHQSFVSNVWLPNVAEFIELDYVIA